MKGHLVEHKTTIYQQSFRVSKSEYETYPRTFTGAETSEMYLWVINADEIDSKTGGEDNGEATIKVTLEDGRSFTADDYVYFG